MNTTTHAPSLVLCELADTSEHGVESSSPFCLKAHRALKLAGLAYDRRHGARPDSFVELNPTGQVPVLLVDGEPVSDSTRILRRIEALSSGALTRGLDAKAQAEAWLWEELADTALNGFVVAARWADDRNWPVVMPAYFAAVPAPMRERVASEVRRTTMERLAARDVWRAGADACWARFEEVLAELEARAPKEGFWMGEAVSVADLGLFAQLAAFRTPLTAPQAESLARRAVLSRYLDRVQAATRTARAPNGVS